MFKNLEHKKLSSSLFDNLLYFLKYYHKSISANTLIEGFPLKPGSSSRGGVYYPTPLRDPKLTYSYLIVQNSALGGGFIIRPLY